MHATYRSHRQVLSALKSQKQLAQQSANEAKRVAVRLQQERAVDEDMYMIMCDNMREKDLEVSPLVVLVTRYMMMIAQGSTN